MPRLFSKQSFLVLIFLGLYLSILPLSAQSKSPLYLSYIDQYKDVVLTQQKKHGIPASIIMAQGLLESGAGQGNLAKKSNNHFGIKCHDWTGPKVYHDDDERGECFRKYKHPRESYEDHSLFLVNRNRYATLFNLKTTDYKGWARGLQQCGYATDKAYANKLIKLIEDYELYALDKRSSSGKKPIKEDPTSPIQIRPVYKCYGLLYVEAQEGETIEQIADEMNFKASKLRSYNDMPREYPLKQGDPVYLQKKLSRAIKPYQYHMIQIGESMHDIAQRYGLQLSRLYKMNKLKKDYIPQEGDLLKLR